jgi:polygalacturonase
VRDVKLFNSPYWTLFLLGCEDIQIRGLLIENPPATANGDGIDIDCCKNVTISDCIIRSGDDSITLRGNVRLLGEDDWICENVVVTNCILSTP